MIGCYPLAVREGRCGVEADVWSSPRREADVLLDDGCSTCDGHLFEPHLSSLTADDLGLALVLNFVRATTDPSSKDFVAAEDRIATFDQDGTLWVEHLI
jgi:hypothetical protein